MSKKFTNFAASTLEQSALAADTVIYIDSDDAALFPVAGAGDTFKAILYDGTYTEIVNCTSRTANALTVSRAQESTTARAWAAGVRIRHTITAADCEAIINASANVVFEGTPSGTDAYTVTLTAGTAIPGLASGETVAFIIPNTNTTAATLNVTNGTDSTVAQSLRDVNGDVFEPGDLKAGHFAVARWDETNTYWRVVSIASRQLYAYALNLGAIPGVNAVPNGGPRDWNLGTSFSTPASGTETADGWTVEYDGTISAFTVSRQTFTPGQTTVPDSPDYFFRWDQSSAGSGSTYRRVKIPLRRRASWRNGEKAIISIRAKADSARTVTYDLVQNFGTGGSPSSDVTALTGSLSLTTSWQQFTITGTLPSISGKTLGSGLNDALILYLRLPLNVTMTIDFGEAQAEPGDIVSRFDDGALSYKFNASNLLTLIKTVDGSGSGLDADTVDGFDIGTSGAKIPLLSTANTWTLAQTFTLAPVFTDQSGSRTALGLGTAAVQNTGTSGANVPLMNGANTWSATQTFQTITNPTTATYDIGDITHLWNNLFVTKIELGHASDTSLARVSAGVVSIEGSNIITAATLLSTMLTLDGSGSGLDADLLDGNNIGTSGATVPLCSGAITWSATHTHQHITNTTTNTYDLGDSTHLWRALYSTTIELGHASDTTLARVSAGVVSIEGVNILTTGTGVKQGLCTIPVLAAAMISATTNGPSSSQVESTTNKVNYKVLDFDTTTQEFAHFQIPMPKSWNNGTVTAQFHWTFASGTGGVVWALEAQAISDADTIDGAWGTAQQIADTALTAGQEHITSSTPAITVGGTPAAGDLIAFRVKRVPADASDTLGVDARLIAVRLFYTANASDDT